MNLDVLDVCVMQVVILLDANESYVTCIAKVIITVTSTAIKGTYESYTNTSVVTAAKGKYCCIVTAPIR